jgi:replicative DNA helicase
VEATVIGSPAERAVIGAILLDSRCFPFVAAELKGSDFSVMQLEQVFDGIAKMLSAREPVDVITVGDRLGEWGVRGLDSLDLHKLVEETPYIAAAGPYAVMVREESVRRALRVAAEHLLQRSKSSEFNPGEAVASSIDELRAIQSEGRQDLQAKPLGDILALTESYDWVIPDLLERKDRLILTGGEGAGKSTFVRQLAIAAAAGLHPFNGTKIEPVRVLVVDAENSEQQWKRSAQKIVDTAIRKGGKADPRTNVYLACAPRLDLTRDSHLGQVHRLIDEHEPSLVFIGPLYRLTSRAITNDDDAAPLLTALDTIRDRNVAMVMEAHAGHARDGSGERDLRPRGSAALMGWPEFGMGIRVNRDFDHLYELGRWRGMRDESRQWPEFLTRGGPGDFPWLEEREMK